MQRLRASPLLADAIFTGFLIAITWLVGPRFHLPGERPFDTWAYLLSGLLNLPLVLRRRYPVGVVLASSALLAGYITAGYVNIGWWAPMIALYTVVTQRRGWTLAGCVVVTVAVMLYFGTLGPYVSPAVNVAQAGLAVAVPIFFGLTARKLAERNARLAYLTEQLRREQADRARRAVADERMRIARELHDVVAHHMSVVAVQAGMAEFLFDRDPTTARRALGTIGGSSREAQEELHRMLQLLRAEPDGTGPESPAPGLDQLATLVDRISLGGLPIEVTVTGQPRPLPPGPDLCAYRVVQESLTNTIKHAGASRVTVALHYGATELAVTVTDNGRGAAGQPAPSGGHGLIGMRERARLYGGTVTTKRIDPGFEVALTLPIPGADQPAGLGLGLTSPAS